jgi:outer membrane protein assembly factor BamA
MIRACCRRLSLLVTLLLSVAAPAFAQQREVTRISFQGAQHFADEQLRAAIVSTQSGCNFLVLCTDAFLNEVALRGDLVRLRLFYFQRGFRAAQIAVDSVPRGAGVEITFRITEGAPVMVGEVRVNPVEDTTGIDGAVRSAFRRALPLRAGEVFNLLEYESGRDTLRARLANLGYARAEVLANYLIPRDSAQLARVEYDVLLGERVRFGPITVEGNANVSDAVVERMLTFQPGQYYSYQNVLRSQRNLFGLETFRHVEIRADPNASTDTLIPVTVQVNEANLHRVRIGAGVSTAEFVNAEGRWTSRNFLGGARRLELRSRLYNLLVDPLTDVPGFEDARDPYDALSGSINADFSQPWFFHPLNTLGVGLYAERRSLPDIFVRTARGGYVSLSRSLGPGTTVALGYRPELTELSAGGDLVFCVNFIACGADEIAALREPHWLSPLALTYARDRSNSLFAPTRGHIVRLDVEYANAATGSDFNYTRVSAEATRYGEPFRGLVLATRLRPGWAESSHASGSGLGLHPQKRFFGGGPNSVRGFAQFRMGPKLLTINAVDHLAPDSLNAPFSCSAQEINAGNCDVSQLAVTDPQFFDVRAVGGAAVLEGNVELRFPFFLDKLRAAAFVDFGQVWQVAEEARLRNLIFTPGFGLRYFSAIGPVRIDVGYNPQAAERLTVVTTKVCALEENVPCTSDTIDPNTTYTADMLANTSELIRLGEVNWGGDRSFLDRLQFHFSIGQAF